MRAKNKLVCGIGINDADYEAAKQRCPFYIKWKSMLERVYTEHQVIKRQNYGLCNVDPSWLIFSNFKKWMVEQDWQGKHLDKDLIGNGLLYSESTCIFVSGEVNAFMNEHSNANGAWPVGVSKRERSKLKKFEAHCNVVDNGVRRKKFLGSFETPEQAHAAWRKEKAIQAEQLANRQSDSRIAGALKSRYTV